MHNAIGRLWRRSHTEPGAALFARLRANLTFWYTGVLAVALILFGVGLYLTVSQVLEQPVDTDVQNFAQGVQRDWQDSVARACGMRPQPRGPQGPQGEILYVACFDPNSNLLATRTSFGSMTDTPDGFPDVTLLKTAITSGTTQHLVTDGSQALYVAAIPVYDRNSAQLLGVLEVGRSVADLENALQVLRTVLLLFGFVTLALAAIGGLFLANRALAPARLAFARQQGFIANVSHELRTPLALLRADADVLLQNKKSYPEEDAELLEDIVQETEYMTTLTTTMLTLARLDAGQAHLEQDVVDLGTVATDLIQRMAAFARAKGIALVETETAPAFVVGDQHLLKQAVLILVDNALKYTPTGGSVSISTEVVDNQSRLVVKDTGIGVAPEQLSHLGERFYRTDTARNRDAGGAGLGLSLAFSIAATHKGTILLDSQPEHGLTAILALPAIAQKN